MTDARERLEALRQGVHRSLAVSREADRSDLTAWLEDIDAILDAMPEGPSTDSGWIDAGLYDGLDLARALAIHSSKIPAGEVRIWLKPEEGTE